MKPTKSLNPIFQTSIPIFLAPAFAEFSIISNATIRSFSSSCCHQIRKKRDLNKRRGESVIRSTGPRHPLQVQSWYKELPKPQAEEDRPVDDFPINPNHGLYGFFNKEKETVIPGEREEQHGRSWTHAELATKSFEDLHALYWQGLLEINRVKTRMLEHRRLKLGYGSMEQSARLGTVEVTQKRIKQVLKTRQEAYDEAQLRREQFGSFEALEAWFRAAEMKSQQKEEAMAESRAASSSRLRPQSATAPSTAPSVPST